MLIFWLLLYSHILNARHIYNYYYIHKYIQLYHIDNPWWLKLNQSSPPPHSSCTYLVDTKSALLIILLNNVSKNHETFWTESEHWFLLCNSRQASNGCWFNHPSDSDYKALMEECSASRSLVENYLAKPYIIVVRLGCSHFKKKIINAIKQSWLTGKVTRKIIWYIITITNQIVTTAD